MESQEYIFTPMGEQPTRENLKKNLSKAIIVVAVVCAVASNFGKSSQQIYYLIAFIAISLIVYCLLVTTKYIRHIGIDAFKGILHSEYITIKGTEGRIEIDLLNAKYSYRFSGSKGYQGYILKLIDGESKLEIRETKSKNKKDQKNRFSKEQLDLMNEVITQIKESSIK